MTNEEAKELKFGDWVVVRNNASEFGVVKLCRVIEIDKDDALSTVKVYMPGEQICWVANCNIERAEPKFTPLTIEQALNLRQWDKLQVSRGDILTFKNFRPIEDIETLGSLSSYFEKWIGTKELGIYISHKDLAIAPKPLKEELIEAKRKKLQEKLEKELEEFEKGLK